MTEIFIKYSGTLLPFSYSIISGLFLFAGVLFLNQKWANTIHYFLTFLLLPPVAFVITKMISTNLALSLGMIGALSIVRFRNPVKNPLELVIYFALITLGVTYGVNDKFGFLLILTILILFIITKLILKFKHFLNLNELFAYSFSTNDGELKNLMEVESKGKIELLEKHTNLIFSSHSKELNIYKLSSSNREVINKLKKDIEKNKDVQNIITRYGE